jgi:hypothetical protein
MMFPSLLQASLDTDINLPELGQNSFQNWKHNYRYFGYALMVPLYPFISVSEKMQTLITKGLVGILQTNRPNPVVPVVKGPYSYTTGGQTNSSLCMIIIGNFYTVVGLAVLK